MEHLGAAMGRRRATSGIGIGMEIRHLRCTTALSAGALFALIGLAQPARAASCSTDLANDKIRFEICLGQTGTTAPDAPIDENGATGGAGESINTVYNIYGQDFPGLSGKSTLEFTAIGGIGGVGGRAGLGTALVTGGAGGNGGNGWNLTLELTSGTTGDGGNNLSPIVLGATGGAGGEGGFYGQNYGIGGRGGDGGTGGVINLTLDPTAAVVSGGPGVTAVALSALGGMGGVAQSMGLGGTLGNREGSAGGAGGSGGAVTATLSGSIRSGGAGVEAFSFGGDGGVGGHATAAAGTAKGGPGGSGGGGGSVTVTLSGASITATGTAAPATGTPQQGQNGQIAFSETVAAVHALTAGGIGGLGGTGDGNLGAGVGGTGGSVASSNAVKIDNQAGTIATSRYGAAGLLAQSIGGHGGNGGYGGGVFVSKGGKGNGGGDAGAVVMTGTGGTVVTTGDSAAALVGQSLGGGGGYGADAHILGSIIGIAVGGDSGSGGNGNQVTISNGTTATTSAGMNGATIVTSGYKSTAIQAQSIGGGGGIAGDASVNELGGVISVAIGGNAGTGGNGSTATVSNYGAVQTSGIDAYGLEVQSIGGGGGKGGAATSLDIGAQLTVASAVGGTGGTGGDGGSASATNAGQIVTGGSNAIGILAQSIGGGGGNGGTSIARNLQLLSVPDVPTLQLSVAVGGSSGAHGKSGGAAGSATVVNDGAVLTSGAAAVGILAQSVGGGGGNGGDASTLSLTTFSTTVNMSTAIGGNGGPGGTGNAVRVDNTGLIGTFDRDAMGIVAQSVGGGGGIGGFGDTSAGSQFSGEVTVQLSVGVGGTGGSGSDGAGVLVNNKSGGVFTLGDRSNGIFAQSIGGGGGSGGGAMASGGGGDKVNINVGVGGSGGAGGNGKTVTVNNDAAIVTAGGQASAVYAQSIGGGGGAGGTGALGGGPTPAVTAANFIAQGLGIDTKTIFTPDGKVAVLVNQGGQVWDLKEELSKILDTYEDLNKTDPKEKKTIAGVIDVNVGGGFGGKGGSSGSGGDVVVTNTGDLETRGAFAEGIFAQSVGGGGGSGGGSAATNDTSAINGTLGIGGRGGSAGNGGVITLTNSGAISTLGDAAFGVFGQSIGGGGGKGGVSAGSPGILTDFSIDIGGNGGANGSGGAVTVNQSGVIVTAGRDAIGILAQSIGGGGGLGTMMTVSARPDNSGGGATSQTGYIVNRSLIPIKIGGAVGAWGDGAVVNVNMTGGSVTTSGIDAYGVLAQSIGGGGGLVIGTAGDAAVKTADAVFGPGLLNGNGAAVNVDMRNGAQIYTTGAGAVGILAQSIGGGGAIVGGMSQVDTSSPVQEVTPLPENNNGGGGDVTVTVGEHTQIKTEGARAHGIFAQSVGNGGGLYGHDDGSGFTIAGRPPLLCGLGGGELPCTGRIKIDVTGYVGAGGAGAYGIYAQSRGNGVNAPSYNNGYDVHISLYDGEGEVSNIYLDSPSGHNRIDNDGYLGGGNGIAIDGTSTAEIYNSLWIRGNLVTSHPDGYAITNYAGGRIYAGEIIKSKGTMINQGELWLGNSATNSTRLYNDNNDNGDPSNLNSTGRIIVGIDFANNRADSLVIAGAANISGQIFVQPINLQAATVPFLVAGSLTTGNIAVSNFVYNDDDTLTPVAPYLYTYNVVVTSGKVLSIKATADFTPGQTSLNANQTRLANHFQGLFDRAEPKGQPVMAELFERTTNDAEYRTSLDSLGADSLGSYAVLVPEADRSFAGAMMSCPETVGQGAMASEQDCIWMRGVGGRIDRGTTAEGIGYKADTGGLQIGGQRHVGDDWLVGASIGWQDSTIHASGGLADIKGDGLRAGLFVKREKGPLLLSLAATGGFASVDISRHVIFRDRSSTATASPDVSHFGLYGQVAWQMPLGNAYARPMLSLNATRVHVNGFGETGSIYALDVQGRTQISFTATPALEVGGHVGLNSGMQLRPYVRAGVNINRGNDWHFDARFASIGSEERFRSTTSLPDASASLGAGANLLMKNGLDLRLQYDAQIGADYSSQQAVLRLAWKF